jgi:3'5'-cyclic nucleotide phosphodiesterase
VIRTKHPLAIRYSDSHVLEHHHLAAAFAVLLNEDNNIFENLPIETYREARKLIINSVIHTDLSKHFTLLTELKTKLGNNFPTDSLEDRTLILSITLRICDHFKVMRGPTIFFKWMDAMFEEFYKQGDMEKVLDLPISKFMDRENTNKEKVFSNYLNVVCRPLVTTYLILINDDDVYGALVREGIDKNKKNLEQRFDGDSGK